MFRQKLKNNLKDKVMRNKRNASDIFDLIEIVIDFDNKLYKRAIKNQFNQLYKKSRIFFKSTIKY